VRLSKTKRTFKKGYLPNLTEELFTVVKCIETSPTVYLVKDDHGEILEGTFYAEELQNLIKTDGGVFFPQVTQADTLSVSLGAIRKYCTSSRCCVLL
jgi:hypothetical protein